MTTIELYTKNNCPYCDRAKALLKAKGAEWEEINVEELPYEERETLATIIGRTVPQIFIGDTKVGGFDELSALNRSGELDRLLQ
jgi:glutaredoxin 3